MNFINEEYILVTEIGYYSRQVSGALNRRTRSNPEVTPYLGSDDVGQCGLAQPRWAVEQDMVERLVPAFGGGDGYFQIFYDRGLPDEIIEAPWAQTGVQRDILSGGFTRYNTLYVN